MSSNTHLASETDQHGRGFLDLGPPIKTYPYKGIQQFWSIWEMEERQYQVNLQDSEWMLFTHVDEESFTREFLNSPDKTIARCWDSYDKTQHLLLIRMTESQAHGAAGSNFDILMQNALQSMGLQTKLKYTRTASRHGKDGSKRPDCQYSPVRLPRGRTTDWPTVVLEVSFSEPASKLMSDVRYWLGQSSGAVQVALTLQIDRRIPKITLEKWEQNDDHGDGRPHRKQSITIRKGAENLTEIRGGPLVIDFEQLFLRPPSTPRESEIRLGDKELRELAISIWREQNFYKDEDEGAEAETDE